MRKRRQLLVSSVSPSDGTVGEVLGCLGNCATASCRGPRGLRVTAMHANSLVSVVFDACMRLPWRDQATGLDYKSRDCRRLHSGHILLPCGIGSPSKHLFRRYKLRTTAHRHRLGRTKYQTTLPPKLQSCPMSASQRFLPRRYPVNDDVSSIMCVSFKGTPQG
jgi:hypothetical protein